MKLFGQWLREQREAKNLTQRGMSRESQGELSPATICLVEQGKRGLSYKNLLVVSEMFGVPVAEIYKTTDAGDMHGDDATDRPRGDDWCPRRVADTAVVLGEVVAREGVVIEHNVVIDGSHAKITLEKNCLVGAGTVIESKQHVDGVWRFGEVVVKAGAVFSPNSVVQPQTFIAEVDDDETAVEESLPESAPESADASDPSSSEAEGDVDQPSPSNTYPKRRKQAAAKKARAAAAKRTTKE